MASDRAQPWWKDPGMVAAALWIVGCAGYYYARFTFVFVNEYEEALRELAGQLADVFALTRRGA